MSIDAGVESLVLRPVVAATQVVRDAVDEDEHLVGIGYRVAILPADMPLSVNSWLSAVGSTSSCIVLGDNMEVLPGLPRACARGSTCTRRRAISAAGPRI